MRSQRDKIAELQRALKLAQGREMKMREEKDRAQDRASALFEKADRCDRDAFLSVGEAFLAISTRLI